MSPPYITEWKQFFTGRWDHKQETRAGLGQTWAKQTNLTKQEINWKPVEGL